MKKVLFFASALLLVFTFSNSFCEKTYEVEKAIVNYKVSGVMSGTMELIFDKYGDYLSTTMENPGSPKTTTIVTPENTYMINWADKTAMDIGILGGMEDDGTGADVDFEADAKKLGTEKILGKTATIYLYEPKEGGSAKFWIWKSIMLKSISEMNGMQSTMEATSLKTPSSIPAKTFKIPSGIKKQSMPSFSLPIPGFGN